MSSRASTVVAPGAIEHVSRLAQQHHAAGFEIGRENRVVDVPLRIEVAEADDVAGAAGELLKARQHARGSGRRLIVQGERLQSFQCVTPR